MTDFSKYTDDELRQMLTEDATPPVLAQAQKRANDARGPKEPVDNTLGFSGPQLAAAGFAKAFADPLYYGPKEALQTIFRKGPEDLEKMNKEKADRKRIDDMLMENWPARMGNTMGQGAGLALGPSRMGAQVALSGLQSAMNPTNGPVESTAGLLATRGMQGLEGAAGAAAIGVPINMAGKVLGAATKRYTPEGQEALRLNDAANRIGVRRNLGSLDQSSGLNAFESNLPGYARTVEEQSKAFTNAAKEEVQIPSKSGRSFENKTLEGEKIRKHIVEAGENLKGVGNSLWKDLDDYVLANNIPSVSANNARVSITDIIQNYTPKTRGQPNLDKNIVLARVKEYDPESFDLLKGLLTPGKAAPTVPFSEMHKLQTAVGKAVSRAEKDAGAPGASLEDRQARTQLKRLYGSLMSDVDAWGTKNPTAQGMYGDAKRFWRDVVVPGAINNKVYSKADRGVYGSNPRGYSEPSQLYSDIVKNPRAVGDLHNYMDPKGRDLIDTLTTVPDVSRSLVTNTPHPPAPGMGTLTTTAGMLLGSPLQLAKGALAHMPGFRDVMNSDAAKKLYFSRNVAKDTPLGKAAWALGRVPEQEVERKVREVREGQGN